MSIHTRHILAMLLAMWCFTSRSTHLVGGELFYDCLGGNQYRITVRMYRDCGPSNSNNTGFDSDARVTIFRTNGIWQGTINLSKQGVVQIPHPNNNPCLTIPPQTTCVEMCTYTTIATLNVPSTGLDLVYQRCCRNSAVVNIQNAQDWGSTLYAQVPPPSVATCNSSPRFAQEPPLALCRDDLLNFDHSATDPDGDSLVYALSTPYHGATPTDPYPAQSTPPPFQLVPWSAGFSQNMQISGSPALSITSQTGILTCEPDLTGIYTMCISVKEYRNGQLLSEIKRDFQVTVVNCITDVEAEISQQSDPGQLQVCEGLTIDPVNSSTGTNYLWNFDDPASADNQSTQFAASHTFSGPGSYDVMIIVNPGLWCADTAISTYLIQPPVDAGILGIKVKCEMDASFDLVADGNFGPAAVFDWDLGALASPSTANTSSILVDYSDTGQYAISLAITDGMCADSTYDTLQVFPVPRPEISINDGMGCAPYTMVFQDSSISWSDLSYYWEFSDGGIATGDTVTHTFQDPGDYDVTLTITSDSVCVGSWTLFEPGLVHVDPSPTSLFDATPDEVNIMDPAPHFTVWELSQYDSSYFIVAGDTIFSPQFQYTFSDTGNHVIRLVSVNEFGCPDTAYHTVRVSPFFTLYCPNAFTPNGDGGNDIFLPIIKDVKTYELWVFDRWGNVVFNTTDQYAGWDGTKNGKPLSDGLYVWQIKTRDAQFNMDREYRGHVVLLR